MSVSKYKLKLSLSSQLESVQRWSNLPKGAYRVVMSFTNNLLVHSNAQLVIVSAYREVQLAITRQKVALVSLIQLAKAQVVILSGPIPQFHIVKKVLFIKVC